MKLAKDKKSITFLHVEGIDAPSWLINEDSAKEFAPQKDTVSTADGVYQGDGSPPIGTYKWNKTNLTYAIVIPGQVKFVDIPDDNEVVRSINFALTSWGLFCPLKFTKVPYGSSPAPDITITFNATDPLFVDANGNQTGVLGYTYFPGTQQGPFTCVLNPSYLWSESQQSVNFSMDINNLLRHELGHGIGCVHTTGLKDIMYPMYNDEIRQKDEDILQVTTMYGPRNPPVNPAEIDGFFNSTI